MKSTKELRDDNFDYRKIGARGFYINSKPNTLCQDCGLFVMAYFERKRLEFVCPSCFALKLKKEAYEDIQERFILVRDVEQYCRDKLNELK